MATTAAVRALLAATSLPEPLVNEMLAGVSAVWLIGEPAETLAGDLVLCHPPLGADEVRAVVRPTADPRAWRLTVVAHDRPGLLAGLAGALADRQLSITEAWATVLPGPGIALQRVTAVRAGAPPGDPQGETAAPGSDAQDETPDSDPDDKAAGPQDETAGREETEAPAGGPPIRQEDWDAVGRRLQAVLGRREAVRPRFRPVPPVTVDCHPQGLGRMMVTVHAPDRVGLMWAVAAWFESHDCNVEAYRATSVHGMAADTFVVVGACDGADLASAIGGVPVGPPARAVPLHSLAQAAGRAAGVAAAAWGGAVRLSRSRRRPNGPPDGPAA